MILGCDISILCVNVGKGVRKEIRMKKLEEFYKEVIEDEALKGEFIAAYKEGTLADFLKGHDCDATAEEAMEYINGIKEGAVCDDDLDNVSGGSCSSWSCGETCSCYTCYGCY